jgi:hypothetical protein
MTASIPPRYASAAELDPPPERLGDLGDLLEGRAAAVHRVGEDQLAEPAHGDRGGDGDRGGEGVHGGCSKQPVGLPLWPRLVWFASGGGGYCAVRGWGTTLGLNTEIGPDLIALTRSHRGGRQGTRPLPERLFRCYKIRGLLRHGLEHLSERQHARLKAGLLAGDPHGEVELAWSCYQQLRAIHAGTASLRERRTLAEKVISSFPTCPSGRRSPGRRWRPARLGPARTRCR